MEARTEAQAYQIRVWRGSTPERPVLLPRRRIVQYLGLNAFELVTGEVRSPATLHTLVLRDSLSDLEGTPLPAELRVEVTTHP
ncbi:hypothetical protein [Myxococcus sp. AM009]|uniref:hypothetical protein n=1 Tax=Myxococcus sp. AM009 TaxID=2745137 RepID=UPI001C3CA5D0|nr:hypothetical protein [Myxococcus sp. AM009]